MEVMITGHNFESILPKDHPCHVCFKLADWFQRRKEDFLCQVTDTGSPEPLVLKKNCHFLCFIYTPETMQNVGFCVNIFKDLPLTRLAALRCAHGLIRILED
jgi:hypothetical protein